MRHVSDRLERARHVHRRGQQLSQHLRGVKVFVRQGYLVFRHFDRPTHAPAHDAQLFLRNHPFQRRVAHFIAEQDQIPARVLVLGDGFHLGQIQREAPERSEHGVRLARGHANGAHAERRLERIAVDDDGRWRLERTGSGAHDARRRSSSEGARVLAGESSSAREERANGERRRRHRRRGVGGERARGGS